MGTEISREYLEQKAEAFLAKAAKLREDADRYEAMAAEFTERATAAPTRN